jgi:hypothetical protein
MLINSISDFRRALRHGPYAWPGGYPCFFVMADGEALSFAAARENRRELLEALNEKRKTGRAWNPDWLPIALEVNWEDESLFCAHSGEPIEAAYTQGCERGAPQLDAEDVDNADAEARDKAERRS